MSRAPDACATNLFWSWNGGATPRSTNRVENLGYVVLFSNGADHYKLRELHNLPRAAVCRVERLVPPAAGKAHLISRVVLTYFFVGVTNCEALHGELALSKGTKNLQPLNHQEQFV